MKQGFLSFLLALGLSLSSCLAQETPPAVSPDKDGTPTEALVIPKPLGQTTPQGWFDDWNAAQAEARRTGRPILVLFTGSDWCHCCQVLREEVLDTPAFQEFARKNLILVFMDSPQGVRLPGRLVQTRRMLNQMLKPGDGAPSLVLLSSQGTRLDAVSGYDPELLSRLEKALKK